MSVYEEIINGTYKKKKQTVYESIINGTYETQSQIAERQKQEQQKKVNKLSTYQDTKKNAMKQIGTQIKQQSEERKQQEEIISDEIKKQVNNINSTFNTENSQNIKLPTVKNTSSNKINNNSASNYRNTVLQETNKKILPTNVRLSTTEEKNNFNELKNGDMYKLSNGAIDDRSEIQKVKDAAVNNIVGPIENAGVGIVQSIGNVVNYEDQTLKLGARTLGRAITKNKQAGDVLGNLLYEKKGRELITGIDTDKYNKDMQALKTWSNETIQRNIENTDNPVSKKIAELTPSVGQNILSMAVGAINPFAGTTLFMTSAAGGYYDDAIDRGMNENQAFGYATIMGIAEGGSESLISGGMVSKVKTALTGSGLSEAFLNSLGTEIIENFAQEAIMEPLSEGVSTVIGGKETANWDNILQRSIDSGIDGILSAILLKGVSLGIGSANNIIEKVNNNQQVTEQDIRNMINDLKKNDKTGYEQTVQGTVDAIVEQMQNNSLNLQQEQTNSAINQQTQQIMQEQNKTSQNETSSELDSMLNNKRLPMQNYQYEKSDNVKINKLRQDANKYFNNSQNAHNFVNMLENIISDKDIEIRLDSNLKTSDGRVANGSYSNGVITINPNSTRSGEFIAVHELTHAIGTEQMKNIVQKYRESNVEFDTAVKNILQNYKTTEINEEALADISGQLFGTQEFINNIIQNNPNIFQKIYSEIKYLWHQFRGYKNQNQFVEDLYYKWTQAYNSNNKLNNTTSYHISENFSNEIDKVLNNQLKTNTQVKARDFTPQILVDNGVENLPMLITQKHIKSTIYTLQEAEDLGLTTKNINYHGLGKDLLIKAIDNLDNPQAIYKTNENNYLVVTEFKDSNGKEIVVPIQINGNGRYNDVFISENQIKSVYGRNNLNNYIDKNNFEQVYIKNKELDFNEGIQYSNVANSSINNSIASSNKDVNTTKYSIAGVKAAQNLIQQSSQYQLIADKYEKAIQMDKEGENNKQIKRKTGWYKDVAGDWKFEFSDADMELKKTNFVSNREYRLSEVLDHEMLFTMYPELANYKVMFKNKSSGGSYINSEKLITIANTKIDNNAEIKGTLIHEIQHAIQNIEGYSTGTTSKNGWFRYLNTLGEIEAADTKERYMNGQNGLPESTKSKPVHPIVKNSNNLLVKIGNSMYNFLNGGVNYGRKNKSNSEENYIRNQDLVELGERNLKENNYKMESENNSGSFSLQNNQTWQEYLENNFKSEGTRTNLKDIKLPTKEYFENKKTEQNVSPYRSEEQIANDKTISDLDAIKEASEQVNTPPLKTAGQRENQLKQEGIYKSPTIDYIKKKRSKERVTLEEIKDTLAQKFVNKGHYIDKLANKTGNMQLTYLYDRTMNTFNEAQISIGEYQITSKGEIVGKSIIDIFQPSIDAGLELEFEDYLLNKHNISRYTYEKGLYGKEISAMNSADIVLNYEKQHPEFSTWAKEVYKYNDNNLKDLVANGMINESTYNKLKEMYGNYVPTYRDITEDMSFYEDNSVGSNPIQKASQSNKDILSIKESMAEQTLMQKKAVRINNLGLELYKTIGKKNKVLDGIEVDPLAIQTITGDVVEKATDGSNIFTIFNKGEMIQFKISDELYTAFSKDTLQSKINNSKVAKIMLTPIENLTKTQRELLTTYSIGFAMTNPIKDFQDALFNTKYSGTAFAKNYTKALYNIATNGNWYISYKNNGGTANTYYDYSKGILPTKTKSSVKKFSNGIKKLNNIMEQAPRLAEYISTMEYNGNVGEALMNAAEITTNFKRGGDITKAVNKYGFNFLNASIQGLDKVYRNITGQNGIKGYTNLLVKSTLYHIAPAILNGLLLRDDDDYDDLPEYIKDDYFLFKMEDGKFFRIPKGRVSAVMGGIARRALETAEGKEVDWKSLVDTTINQLAPNSLKNSFVLAPLIQASTNEAWYGGDIVSTRLQKLPIAEQYDESTDEFSKWLGATLNISPKKINYVIDQYGGGIGDIILPMLTPQAENNILEDKFTVDAVMKNKNVSKYYSELEELQKKNNSISATDEDKLKYKYISDSSSDISDLYEEKRKIQNLNIPDNEKKEQVRKVQEQINNIVKEKLNKVNGLEINDNIAKIDKTEYYKAIKLEDGSQEWRQLSEEEQVKNKDISLKTYANYKEKVAKETIAQRKSGEIEEKESLKTKDKIQVLLNSNYSDKEMRAIYENYIKSEDDLQYTAMKAAKMNITEYLKYKTQEFTSDKEDNGTLNGKTVSKSKQKKVVSYLNSVHKRKAITGNQSLLLYAMQGYSTTATQKNQLAKYVKSLNLSKEDTLKLYNKFSGFTVYKNGKVEW